MGGGACPAHELEGQGVEVEGRPSPSRGLDFQDGPIPSKGMDVQCDNVRKESNGALYLNIRGVYPKTNRTKISYIRDLASLAESAFIVMTETHLSSDILDAEVAIQGYTSYRDDRAEPRTHGGSMIYVRNDLASQLVARHSNGYCETVIVKAKTLDTLVLCIYRPPDCNLAMFREALEVCQAGINTTMSEDSKIRNI